MTNAKTVAAKLQIGNAQIPITHITLTHTIDELPTAEVHVQMDNAGAADSETRNLGSVEINLAKIQSLMRITQEKIVNDFSVSPDTQLAMIDGDGNAINFKGHLGRPSFRIRDGEMVLSFSVTHAKACLQAFNARIYGSLQRYVYNLADLVFKNKPDALRSASVADTISAVLEYLVKNIVYMPRYGESETGTFDTLPLHHLNLTVIDHVRNFLKLSSKTTEIDGLQVQDFSKTNLVWCIYAALINNSNFFQAIAEFNKMFLFQLNASYEGDAWIEWQQQNTDPGKRVIEAPLQNIVFGAASIYELPVIQVLVQGVGMSRYVLSGDVGMQQAFDTRFPQLLEGATDFQPIINATGNEGVQLNALAKWPPNVPRNAVGTFYVIQAPSWTNPDMVTLDLHTTLAGAPKKASRFRNYVEQTQTVNNAFTKSNNVRKKLLTYMAKQSFKTMILGATQGGVTIPLNLKVRPGYTYTVKSITGETLFIGYLQSVMHDISIGTEGGAAVTSLSFTHIRVEGANLRVLAANPTFPMASVNVNYQDAVNSILSLIDPVGQIFGGK